MANKKRTGYLRLHEEIELTKVGLTVWAYNKRGSHLGRIEINRAGVAVYTGPTGRQLLGDMKWEQFFEEVAEANGKSGWWPKMLKG